MSEWRWIGAHYHRGDYGGEIFGYAVFWQENDDKLWRTVVESGDGVYREQGAVSWHGLLKHAGVKTYAECKGGGCLR